MSPEEMTREDAHKARAEHMEQVQKQHPETDMKLDSGWWKPGIDFTHDVKERLDKPTNDRMNAIIMKLFSQSKDPDAAEECMKDARDCLKDHPDLMEQFDAIFKGMSPNVLATVELMRQQGCGDPSTSK